MLLRRIARPLLSAVFIAEGIETLQNPQPLADKLGPALDFTRRKAQHRADSGFAIAPSSARPGSLDAAIENARVETEYPVTDEGVSKDGGSAHRIPTPPIPESPETVARAIAIAQIGSAALLAIGKAPRPAAAVLAGTTAVGLSTHAFWSEVDPDRKKSERTEFLTGLSKLGGLLIATADTEGQPSLGWRGRRAAHNATERAEALAATAAALAVTARERASEVAETVHDRTIDIAETAKERVHLAEPSPKLSRRNRRAARKAQARTANLVETARERGSEWVETAREKGAGLAETVRERGPELAEAARERGSELAETVREKSSEWADTARERGPQLAEAARERAQRAAEAAREKGPQLAEAARDRGSDLAEAARDRGPQMAELARERAQRAADVARQKAELAKAKADVARAKAVERSKR